MSIDPTTALVNLLASPSSEDENKTQRYKARLLISQYHEEFSKVVASGNINDPGLADIATNSILSAMHLAAFGGKVKVFHKDNSLYGPITALGELTSVDRDIPMTKLPSWLHSSYQNGYSTLLPAVHDAVGWVRYLKATLNPEVTHEILLVVLDEGQTSLPNDPVWIRIGRYEVVNNLSDDNVISRFERIRGDMIIAKSLVHLQGRPPISRANFANAIRSRIILIENRGIEFFLEIASLEALLQEVVAKTEEFTLDSLRELVM